MIACGGEATRPTPTPPPAAAPPAPAPPPSVAVVDLRSDVLDRAALQALEQPSAEASLMALLAREAGQAAPTTSHPDLAQASVDLPGWAALGGALVRDIDAINDGAGLTLVTELAEALAFPAGNVGRRLDSRWLQSRDAHFVLAGVVNRLDRRDLHPTPSCGELRLIYRLAYETAGEAGAVGSRLPLTLNLVLRPQVTEDCAGVARAWAGLPDAGAALATALRAGPLDLDRLALDRVEVNAQVLRLPSGLETEFAGQAAYLLAVYRLACAQGSCEARRQPLENSPDVGRLLSDPALRADLDRWINENIDAIDKGTYLIPERFLADQALSWSNLGVNRLANHPFSALYPAEERHRLEDPAGRPGLGFVASRAGLVERLDNGSCSGCHQAGSTAGFHLLGEDDPALAGITNRLAVPVSPHLAVERDRRRLYLAAVANGDEPPASRAHSLAPGFGMKGLVAVAPNQPCPPAKVEADLAPLTTWSCSQEAGPADCRVVAEDPRVAVNWGQCLPRPEDPRALAAGMTCRGGQLHSGDPSPDRSPWNLGAAADRVELRQLYDLPEDKTFSSSALNCRPTRIGVPLGRTYRSCRADERGLEQVRGASGGMKAELCAVVGGSAFDRCVEKDFHGCLEQIVGRGMVASCSLDQPCREDSICQALPHQLDAVPGAAGRALAEAGIGFCTPTYFLFQMRLDGHPVPRP